MDFEDTVASKDFKNTYKAGPVAAVFCRRHFRRHYWKQNTDLLWPEAPKTAKNTGPAARKIFVPPKIAP
jgi:hypothetical protein